MPANTPNRSYPYPLAADPADVPQALEDLADAVDADLVQISPTIVARRAARVRQQSPISFGTTATSRSVPFTQLDFNQNGALAVFPGNPSLRVIPGSAGFWVVTGSVSFTDPGFIGAPGAAISRVDLEVNLNNFRIGRQSSEAQAILGYLGRNRTLTAGGGRLMNGTTDYFNMNVSIVRNAANPNAVFVVTAAAMTLWQMTLS